MWMFKKQGSPGAAHISCQEIHRRVCRPSRRPQPFAVHSGFAAASLVLVLLSAGQVRHLPVIRGEVLQC